MLYHSEVLDQAEIVVIDNNPRSKEGGMTHDFIKGRVPNGRYIAYSSKQGTAPPRSELFRQAKGKYVLCLDSHVLLEPGSIRKLLEYYDAHSDCNDLLTGPLLLRPGKVAATYQRPKWGGGALGVWSMTSKGGHSGDEPFSVWQQGLGCFSCRKDAWLDFHPDFRGFGGSESYLCEKYRRAGHRVMCLPFLRWLHLFRRSGETIPYDPQWTDKLRNYLIAAEDLGDPIAPIIDHFESAWNKSSVRKVLSEFRKERSSVKVNIAVCGHLAAGSVKMRGISIADRFGWDKLNHNENISRRYHTILAVKRQQPTNLRSSCDRLIYDPIAPDSPWRGDPLDYWQAEWRRLKFDDILATSPSCAAIMEDSLKDCARVHLVPHHCDSRIVLSYKPNGPIVYNGLRTFLHAYEATIGEACRLAGRVLVIAPNRLDALEGAALVLHPRMPPHNTLMTLLSRPQIKIENAAAAGIPVLATDDPCVITSHPEVYTAPVEEWAVPERLAHHIKLALKSKPPEGPVTIEQSIERLGKIIGASL